MCSRRLWKSRKIQGNRGPNWLRAEAVYIEAGKIEPRCEAQYLPRCACLHPQLRSRGVEMTRPRLQVTKIRFPPRGGKEWHNSMDAASHQTRRASGRQVITQYREIHAPTFRARAGATPKTYNAMIVSGGKSACCRPPEEWLRRVKPLTKSRHITGQSAVDF